MSVPPPTLSLDPAGADIGWPFEDGSELLGDALPVRPGLRAEEPVAFAGPAAPNPEGPRLR